MPFLLGLLWLILTQMDRFIPFMVALVCIGLVLVSFEQFPNLWKKAHENAYGDLAIKGIKALALFLIACAFWIRVYQNMTDIESIFTSNMNMTDIENIFKSNIHDKIKKEQMTDKITTTSDKIFDKMFEVVLSLILASILPVIGAWTAYQRDPGLLKPTDEWKNGSDEVSRHQRQLSRQESYPNSNPHGGPKF